MKKLRAIRMKPGRAGIRLSECRGSSSEMGRYLLVKLISRFLALVILPAGLLGQTPAPAVPKGHGLYYQTPKALVPIVGQAVASARAGSPLFAAPTFGLERLKLTIVIAGQRGVN